MKKLWLLVVLALAGLAFAQGAVKINFWYAMGGGNGKFLQGMVDNFNATHPGIQVIGSYKGNYRDTLNATILAARQRTAPNIVQIFDVGTQIALDSKIFTPFYKNVSASQQAKLLNFIAAVAGYYQTDGNLGSVPFNSSNPVLYYNKTIFKKAGLDPNSPPTTFGAVLKDCQQIEATKAAADCMTWPLHSWFIEQWVADQGALLVNHDNGRSGRATKVLLDSAAMQKIMNWWKEMYVKGYYVYSGKPEDWSGANSAFFSQQVAMEITSTSDITIHNIDAKKAGYELGIGFLPIPDGVTRHGTVIGGASLWMTKGHSQVQNRASVTFLLWLTNADNQIAWSGHTGYFPVVLSAVRKLTDEGWYNTHPNFAVAVQQLLKTQVGPATQGARMGPFPQVRTIVENAVQKIFSGTPVNQALKAATHQANQALTSYNSSVK